MFELTASPGLSRRILGFLTFALLATGALVIFNDQGGGGAVFFLTFAGDDRRPASCWRSFAG